MQYQKHNNYFVLVRYRWEKTGEHRITSGSLVSCKYIYSTHHTDSKLQFRFKGTTRTYSKKNKTTVYISLVLKNCCQSISSQDKAIINLTWAIFYFTYLWAFFCHLTSTLLSIKLGFWVCTWPTMGTFLHTVTTAVWTFGPFRPLSVIGPTTIN